MTSVKLPSNRSFGTLFTIVFAVLVGYGIWKDWPLWSTALFGLTSLVLAFVTLFNPRILAPLNNAWFHFGHLLGKVVNPLILGTIYYGLITPVALITRLLGRDELKIKHRNIESYWVERSPLSNNSFKNQF